MRWLGLVLLPLFLDVRPAKACAPAPPPGKSVEIAEEEALIVWDPATKTEQFIRRAAFRSTARQFGFLVPTPTVPQLSEVSDSIFYDLARLIEPPVDYQPGETKWELGSWLLESCLLMKGSDSKQAAAPPPVRVIATAHVAGFDATTVEADDANALTAWLGGHGFEATPKLTEWLDRYVKDKWKITAFVVASDEAEGANNYDVATKAVKMTFPAERPFYPYREPKIEVTVETNAKMVPPPRLLRVFFVSDQRYAATLAGEPWSATVLQANALTWAPPDLMNLFGAQKYMTVFHDESSPRRGLDELYFAPSADKSDVKQKTEVIEVPQKKTFPIDLVILGVIVGFCISRRLRKRRAAIAP